MHSQLRELSWSRTDPRLKLMISGEDADLLSFRFWTCPRLVASLSAEPPFPTIDGSLVDLVSERKCHSAPYLSSDIERNKSLRSFLRDFFQCCPTDRAPWRLNSQSWDERNRRVSSGYLEFRCTAPRCTHILWWAQPRSRGLSSHLPLPGGSSRCSDSHCIFCHVRWRYYGSHAHERVCANRPQLHPSLDLLAEMISDIGRHLFRFTAKWDCDRGNWLCPYWSVSQAGGEGSSNYFRYIRTNDVLREGFAGIMFPSYLFLGSTSKHTRE